MSTNNRKTTHEFHRWVIQEKMAKRWEQRERAYTPRARETPKRVQRSQQEKVWNFMFENNADHFINDQWIIFDCGYAFVRCTSFELLVVCLLLFSVWSGNLVSAQNISEPLRSIRYTSVGHTETRSVRCVTVRASNLSHWFAIRLQWISGDVFQCTLHSVPIWFRNVGGGGDGDFICAVPPKSNRFPTRATHSDSIIKLRDMKFMYGVRSFAVFSSFASSFHISFVMMIILNMIYIRIEVGVQTSYKFIGMFHCSNSKNRRKPNAMGPPICTQFTFHLNL